MTKKSFKSKKAIFLQILNIFFVLFLQVNLDSLTKDSLVTKMAQPTHTTFDQAQKRIQGLLEADAYSRFLKSELYMELLHPEKYQQASP